MLDKTKATIPGRQCSTENREQNQHTRPAAGGQSLSAPEITGTAPLARFTPVLAFTPWRGTALQHTQSPEFSVATISQIVGCILNTRQYFPQWGECEPVAHTLFLRTALGCVQILPLCSPVLANSNIECRGQRNSAPADYIHFFSSSLAFLRCSDLSLRPQASRTHAEKLAPELSAFSRSTLASISSIRSCGKRIFLVADFALTDLVTISIPQISVGTPYIKKECKNSLDVWPHFKLDWCGRTLFSRCGNSEARQCANTNRASNQTVS